MKIVTSVDIGAKVVRGPDWGWRDQDEGSVYGVIVEEGNDDRKWVNVVWIDIKGNRLRSNTYRIGPNEYDLCYYEEPLD